MVKLSDLLDILGFQLNRENVFLMKVSLELLENARDHSLKLEHLLQGVGFEDKELFRAEENYRLARKKILDEFNSRNKQIQELIQKFNVDIGGK